jgi:hypothetical protein
MNAARHFESTKMRVYRARVRVERLRRDVDADAPRVAQLAASCAGAISLVARLRERIAQLESPSKSQR